MAGSAALGGWEVSGFRGVVVSVVLVAGLMACNQDATDVGRCICPTYFSMEPCADGSPDRPGEDPTGRPESCVGGYWQLAGLGRCVTDEDCARWSGSSLVPGNADPPSSRCVEFAELGEWFCEGFTGPGSRVRRQCEPGWPCGRVRLGEAPEQHCVSQPTRSVGTGEAQGYVSICLPGPPADLVDRRCYGGWGC